MPDNMKNQYSQFKEKRDELAEIIHKASQIMEALSMPKFADRLSVLRRQVDNDSFKIQIVGTFKNGKSTFINALIGEDVLPTKALPCTAVINELKYGETKRAVLHFRNPLPERLLADIPEPTLAHMKAYGMKDVPPMEIEYDHMDRYVTIPVNGDPEEISLSSPYQTVELFYPSEYLKDGVEIIDSPGLNESDARTNVTLEYLERADAVIFLLDATKACAADEMEMVEGTLTDMGFDDMFFVLNKIDAVPAKERADVVTFVNKTVGSYTPHDIYPVAALKAVEARTGVDRDGDELSTEECGKLLAKSGMIPFEERLTTFLTQDKGRIKLARPARELNSIIVKEALHNAVPAQRKMLDTNLTELQRRRADAEPRLRELESQKEQLYNTLTLRIKNSQNDLRRAIMDYYQSMITSVPKWIEQYEPANKPGFASKRKVQECTEELVNYVTEKLKTNFTEWNTGTMQPLVAEKVAYIFDSTEQDLGSVMDSIEQVNASMSGISPAMHAVKPWERVAGAGLTLVLPGAAAGVDMMTQGFNAASFGKNIAIDLGVFTGMCLLASMVPIIGWIGMIGLVWRGISQGKAGNLKKIKAAVTEEVVKSLTANARPKAEELSQELAEKLMRIAVGTVEVLDGQIADVRHQVDSIIADLKEGQQAVDRKRHMLDACDNDLQQLSEQLSAMVFELVGLTSTK